MTAVLQAGPWAWILQRSPSSGSYSNYCHIPAALPAYPPNSLSEVLLLAYGTPHTIASDRAIDLAWKRGLCISIPHVFNLCLLSPHPPSPGSPPTPVGMSQQEPFPRKGPTWQTSLAILHSSHSDVGAQPHPSITRWPQPGPPPPNREEHRVPWSGQLTAWAAETPLACTCS